ncbi:sensor histidine kinase [Pseudonocardia ailaonensis]
MSEQTVPGPVTVPRARGVLGGLRYLVLGLPLCIVAFVVAIAGFAAGVSTFVVWVGLPILTFTFVLCRRLADVERRATERVLGRPLPPHHYRPRRGRGAIGLLGRVVDPQSWRDLLHAVIGFPVRLTAFIVGVVWSVGGLGAALYPLWEWSLPHDQDYNGLFDLITGSASRVGDVALNTALGVGMLLSLPFVVRTLVAVRAGVARGLLTNRNAALRARAEQLAAGRRAAVAAEAATLRRLERDIHDGPQQRLVRLTMDLEAAGRRLDDDPERARPLIAEALAQTHEALAELRALSRGIAPPILADRGLGAALAAAAARSTVPVSVDVTLRDRPAAAVENTAYFVVTEALTNVAKHSGATHASVEVGPERDELVVSVTDDGVGGAHLGKGHGLSGLSERLSAVEGRLDVTSPEGGPTVVRAWIPLAGLEELS